MPEKFQSYDELSSGGGASPGSIEDATRVAERRARARTRSAAETLYEQASEVLATPGGTAAARERAPAYPAPERGIRDRLNDVVQYFRNLNSAQFSADAKQFIRRHPESLAGAVVAGFVLGRLLRRL